MAVEEKKVASSEDLEKAKAKEEKEKAKKAKALEKAKKETEKAKKKEAAKQMKAEEKQKEKEGKKKKRIDIDKFLQEKDEYIKKFQEESVSIYGELDKVRDHIEDLVRREVKYEDILKLLKKSDFKVSRATLMKYLKDREITKTLLKEEQKAAPDKAPTPAKSSAPEPKKPNVAVTPKKAEKTTPAKKPNEQAAAKKVVAPAKAAAAAKK